jgi:hypothetical protein
VPQSATVMHDQYPGYQNLHKLGYDHHTVNHGKTYGRAKVIHNENIEGLWGRIKPGIKGVYRKISSKYIESYMDEYCLDTTIGKPQMRCLKFYLGALASRYRSGFRPII